MARKWIHSRYGLYIFTELEELHHIIGWNDGDLAVYRNESGTGYYRWEDSNWHTLCFLVDEEERSIKEAMKDLERAFS